MTRTLATCRPRTPAVLRVAFIAFALTGLALIAGSAYSSRGALSSRFWQPTPCTILSSTVKMQNDENGPGYGLAIEYQYQFNGRTYTSNRFGFTQDYVESFETRQEMADHFKPGTTTTCYVDPNHPQSAAIDRTIGGLIMIAGFGAWAAIMGITGLILTPIFERRRLRKRQSEMKAQRV